MCDFENYEEAVRLYLPQVIKLDGQESLVPGVKSIPKKKKKSVISTQNIQNNNPNKPQTAPSRMKSPILVTPQ